MIRGVSQNPERGKNVQFVFKYNENIRLLKANEVSRRFDCTVLICGATGSGKSAFLNSVVNFVEGRSTENLIIASKTNKDDQIDPRFVYNKQQNNLIQQTSDVLCIQVLWKGKEILFIDTPGYDENNQGKIDMQILNKIQDVCRCLKKIDYIFFVQKYSETQFFKSSELFLMKICELFNSKFFLMLTFKTGRQLFDEKFLPFKVHSKYCLNNGIFSYAREKLLGNNAKEAWDKIYRKVEMIMNEVFNDLKLGVIDEKNEYEENMLKKLLVYNYSAKFVEDKDKNMVCSLCFNTCLRKVSKDFQIHELNREYSVFSNQFNDKMMCKHCDHPKEMHDCFNIKLQVIIEEKNLEGNLKNVKSIPKILYKEDRKEHKDLNNAPKQKIEINLPIFEINKSDTPNPLVKFQPNTQQRPKQEVNIRKAEIKTKIEPASNKLNINNVLITKKQRGVSNNQMYIVKSTSYRNKK